jgi:pimeloyl-ACP methyl ester carboxylesterase
VDILRARAIEHRLMEEVWSLSVYNLLPALERLRVSTLVIYSDCELFPVPCVNHIAQAIPGARFVVLPACGRLVFLERPDEVQKEIANFFADA